MDCQTEVREFLVSRRAKLTPAQVGLPAGRNRRVPGLRRGEVAALAGLSIEYYTKIERGSLASACGQVLDAIGPALQLDDAERTHLVNLFRPVHRPGLSTRPSRRPAAEEPTRPSLQWALDAVTAGPAFLRNGRMDLLAVNRLARAFYADVYTEAGRPPNLARFTFLDPPDDASIPIGTWPRTSVLPSCVPKPDATPTTGHCTTSSANSRLAARSSASAGPATTYGIRRRHQAVPASRRRPGRRPVR